MPRVEDILRCQWQTVGFLQTDIKFNSLTIQYAIPSPFSRHLDSPSCSLSTANPMFSFFPSFRFLLLNCFLPLLTLLPPINASISFCVCVLLFSVTDVGGSFHERRNKWRTSLARASQPPFTHLVFVVGLDWFDSCLCYCLISDTSSLFSFPFFPF